MSQPPKPGDRVRANKRFAFRAGGERFPIIDHVAEGMIGTVVSVRKEFVPASTGGWDALVRWDDGLEAVAAAVNLDVL